MCGWVREYVTAISRKESVFYIGFFSVVVLDGVGIVWYGIWVVYHSRLFWGVRKSIEIEIETKSVTERASSLAVEVVVVVVVVVVLVITVFCSL